MTASSGASFAFPGRWIGGLALIVGPLLLLAGALLRLQFHFFFPQQLEAFAAHPTLMTAAYSAYSLGSVALAFAIITLSNRIAGWSPVWATWAGGLALIGLFNRTFSAGVDHLAFQLVRVQGVEAATAAVRDSYRVYHVFRSTNGCIMLGWLLLAVGAYRSGVLPQWRALALGLMVMLPMGTLKGTEIRSVAIVGLCVALIPLGIEILRDGPALGRRAKRWVIALIAFEILTLFLVWRFPILSN